MTRRYTLLAWSAAVCTYLLIVLGAVVRITGSGLGCGNPWPLCNGRLFPPLDDIGTVIEWSHRLVAALVTILVVALAAYTVWLRRRAVDPGPLKRAPFVNPGLTPGVREPNAAFVAVGLLALQIALGAITVKLELPAWTVILHLATAMLLFATLLLVAHESRAGARESGEGAQHAAPLPVSAVLDLAFVTVLFGALTANLGAAVACSGFPLCNGQVWPQAGTLAQIHWVHRLLAYSLVIAAAVWAIRTPPPGRGPRIVLGLVALHVGLGAATVLLGLPRGLQAAHLATGTAVWAAVVLASHQTKAPMV